jgi:hypothetical protein
MFLVGTGPQLDTAKRVAAHLRAPAEAYDLWHHRVVPLADLAPPSAHVTPVSVGNFRRVGGGVREWARRAGSEGVFVVPQDVGLLQRRAVAAARRAGAAIVLLPDGAVSEGAVTQRGGMGGLVAVVDGVLRATGLVAGRWGEMAASRPDLVLSWGRGWDAAYAARGAAAVADTGSPRADDLGDVPPPDLTKASGRLLVCSQPTWQAVIGGEASAAAWYAFLERLAGVAPAGALRVRLHPQERERLDSLPVGERTRDLLTEGTTLAKDLSWSTAVLSWASTTLLEAAGAGRPVLSVAVNQAAAELATGYPFLRDERLIRLGIDDIGDWEDLSAAVKEATERQQPGSGGGFAADYLANVGSAARRAATALEALR